MRGSDIVRLATLLMEMILIIKISMLVKEAFAKLLRPISHGKMCHLMGLFIGCNLKQFLLFYCMLVNRL